MADYAALKAELQKPDLSGLSDAAAASKLNADTVTTTVPRSIVPSYEVLEAMDPTEWAALTSDNKTRIQMFISAGSINIQGTNTRNAFAAAFGAGTASRAALLALQNTTVVTSRAVAIAGWGIPASAADVNHARSLT